MKTKKRLTGLLVTLTMLFAFIFQNVNIKANTNALTEVISNAIVWDLGNGREVTKENGVYKLTATVNYAMKFDFDLTKYDNQLQDGQTFEVPITGEYTLEAKTFPLIDPTTNVAIANLEIISNGKNQGGKVKVTLQNLEEYKRIKGSQTISGVKGSFYVNFNAEDAKDTNKNITFGNEKPGIPNVISAKVFPKTSSDYSQTIGTENFAKIGGVLSAAQANTPYFSQALNKQITYRHEWTVRVNTRKQAYDTIEVEDFVPEDSSPMQFIPEKFEVVAGDRFDASSLGLVNPVILDPSEYTVTLDASYTRFTLTITNGEGKKDRPFLVKYHTTAPNDGTEVINSAQMKGNGVQLPANVSRPTQLMSRQIRKSFVASGGNISIQPGYRIVLYKVDAETNQPIQGIQFKVTKPDGTDLMLDPTDVNGRTYSAVFTEQEIAAGNFTVTELSTPERYEPIAPFTVTVKKNLAGTVKQVKNQRKNVNFQITKRWENGPESDREKATFELYRQVAGGQKELVTGVDAVKEVDPLNNAVVTYTWSKLPEYSETNELYVYSAEEANVVNGQVTIDNHVYDVVAENETTFINQYVVPKTTFTVSKVWVNGPTVKPDIQIQLYRQLGTAEKEAVGNPVTLTNGTIEHVFNDLPATNDAGVSYVYSAEEKAVTNYTTKYDLNTNGVTVTNTYTVPKTTFTVNKVWENGPTVKPDIQIQLYRQVGTETKVAVGNPVTLTNGTIKHVFNDLPATNDAGEHYVYSVEELAVDGYTTSYNNDTTTITNTFVVPTKEITVQKLWVNGPTVKPEIQIQLYRNVENGTKEAVGQPVKLSNGQITHTYRDLPTVTNDGKLYEYTVEELPVENYKTTYSADTFSITNTYESPLTTFTVNKVWVNGPDVKPSITLQLYRQVEGGVKEEAYPPITLNNGELTYEFKGIAKTDKDGKDYTYTVEEVAVDGYTTTYNSDTTEITNTFIIPTTEITVNKLWVNGPVVKPTIEIQLFRQTLTSEKEAVGQPVALTNGTQIYVFKDLPTTDLKGEAYVYTVEEAKVENYIAAYSQDTFTITNTYETPKTSFKVKKVWINAPVTKPDITFVLMRNGVALEMNKVLSNGVEEVEWNDLDLTDKDGNQYVYTVKELPVKGYTTTYNADTTVITNTFNTPENPTKPKVDTNDNTFGYVIAMLLSILFVGIIKQKAK